MTVQAPSAPATRPGLKAPLRVLVVDDEPMLTDLLSLALRLEGWTVATAADGEAALAAIRIFAPDVVVLDFMLPLIDGPGVIRSIRASRIDTPVLMLTARDSIDDRMAAFSAGGDDYLAKPFGLDEVVVRIRSLMRHRVR